MGLDHICLTSNDILKDSKFFEKYGYEVFFHEKGIKIENEKKSFLKNSSDFHDFALLKSTNSVSIELIDHHKFNDQNQIYDILFNTTIQYEKNHVQIQEPFTQKLENIFNKQILKNENKNMNCIFYQNHTNFVGVNSIIIKTNDIKKSKNFWCDLFGFVEKSSNNNLNYKILEFDSPVKNWCIKFILIKENQKLKTSFLNNYGCTCMSFLVTKIDDFLQKYNEFGFECMSKSYKTTINGKKMKLIFLRGFDNEIIELIEFSKNE